MLLIPATLISKELSPDTTVSYLTFRPMQSIDFTAGQFVMIHCQTSWGPKKKPYSIASTPHSMQQEKTISFYIKQESENGCSAYLTRDIQIWDRVMLQWPLGHYVDTNKYQDYLFISTGSGLAPNLSIATELTHLGNYGKIGFLFGERNIDTLPPTIVVKLQALQVQIKNYTLCLSQQTTSTEISFTPGRINTAINDILSTYDDITKVSYFICGKPEMVTEISNYLMSLGIDRQDITMEKY